MNNEINAMAARIERNVLDARLAVAAERTSSVVLPAGRIRSAAARWAQRLHRESDSTVSPAQTDWATTIMTAAAATVQG